MTQGTLTAVKEALKKNSLYSLFQSAIGRPEDMEDENKTSYALMFNFENPELFFLEYATNKNGWAKTAASQNPWLCIGYVSATDILMGDPASEISDRLEYEFEQRRQMNRDYR